MFSGSMVTRNFSFLFRRFDPFSNRQHIEAFRQRQHRVKYGGSDRFRTDGVDKSTVNFQIIERKTLKIDKRAVPGAEVINSNFYADKLAAEGRPDGGVIGRFFHAANFIVDAGFYATFCQRLAGEQQVDAQTTVIVKTF